MPTIEKSIDVNVPAPAAYQQWTQLEAFPLFMEDVEDVREVDTNRTRWTASITGKRKQWESVIDEQIPNKRIAWHSVEGAHNAGCVTFHRLSDNTTRIMLQLEYTPETAVEKVGDWLGVVTRSVERDLGEFKEFVESRDWQLDEWSETGPGEQARDR